MNQRIETLFQNLSSPDVGAQMESALALAFVLERALNRRHDETSRQWVLTDELLRLKLDALDLEEALARTSDQLEIPTTSFAAKVTLTTVLGKTGQLGCMKAILALLEREYGSLSDEDASGVILAMIPGIRYTLPRDQLRLALDEHHVLEVLERLAARGSERLSEPLTRFRLCISKVMEA